MYALAILAGLIWGATVLLNVAVGRVLLGPFDLLLTGIPALMCVASFILPRRVRPEHRTGTIIALTIAGLTFGVLFLVIALYRTLFIVAAVQ